MAELGLEEKLARLPERPGVYIMKDEHGQVLYVGKAASLKDRVRTYFGSPAQLGPRTRALVSHVRDLEYILVDSPVEALILENNLIKRYHPRYNVYLRDDKTYPYLKLTVQDRFPRLSVTRSLQKDGARYFGPYTNAGAMHETVRLLKRVFPLRTCTDRTLREGRACLNAHIHRCLAPCTGQVSAEEYRRVTEGLILFLEGRQQDLVETLRRRMEEAAEDLRFEEAARLRDQLRAVQEVLAEQKIVSEDQEDRDVVAVARDGGIACGQVFFVRGGKLVGREHFFLGGVEELERPELMATFLQRFYSRVDFIPPEILLEEEAAEPEVLAAWLQRLRGGKVRLSVPRRGPKRKLCQMVHRNALLVLEEYRLAEARKESAGERALLELQEALGLPSLPRRIECYDISNIQGSNSVGSLTVAEGGELKPEQYRRFKIRSVEGPDDFASLAEVLRRRFAHAEGEARFARRPDLVIVDGGRGQLSAARTAMREKGVEDIPAFGLAKEEELLFAEGNPQPIRLPRDSAALQLLQRLRDEAHRFAITYHRRLREKEQQHSLLDEIPGVGARRRRALLQHFGSVQRLRQAEPEELASVPGISPALARRIHAYLQGQG